MGHVGEGPVPLRRPPHGWSGQLRSVGAHRALSVISAEAREELVGFWTDGSRKEGECRRLLDGSGGRVRRREA
jgi:hypothetical protein